MPTGLTNTPFTRDQIPAVRPGRPAINATYKAIFSVTGQPINMPAVSVPPNASVYIRGHNGTNSGNAQPCRAALSPEGLLLTKGDVITPDTEITFPVNNLGQIWAVGTAADRIVVSIRAVSTA
jgi:hypothetical protein